MAAPNLTTASLDSLTGSDNATGSITVYFSENMQGSSLATTSNYNFSPSLTIASASILLTPEVWFKMDEGTGTSITSSNGLYSGSFEAGSTALSWESGSYSTGSYSIFFDQSSDYITPPTTIWPESTDDMITISFWARLRGDAATGTDSPGEVACGGWNSSGYRTATVWMFWTDGLLYWQCGDNGGGTYDSLTFDWDASSYDDSTQWHHWAFTKKISTGQMRIYLDGVDVANSTGNTQPFLPSLSYSKIGSWYANNYNFAGNMSDFAIWDTELSASDITTLYNDGSGSSPSAISSSNLLVLYPFQEGAGSTAYDKSGNSRDGTITNSHWAYADPTPQPRTFVKFPHDKDSLIDCGHHPNFGTGSTPGPMSVAAWVRFNNNPENYERILEFTEDNDWTDGWALHWYSDQFRFWVETWNTNYAYYSCDENCAVKQWNHVVGTWDNSTIKIYVNGVEGTSDSYSGDMSMKVSELLIGGPNDGGSTVGTDATINDVRIYPGKALTQAEVTTLYNERESLDNPKSAELVATGIDTSQGYILDVSSSIVSFADSLPCTVNSASFMASSGRELGNDFSSMKPARDGFKRTMTIERKPGLISNLSAQPLTTTTTDVPLTVKYFQRVYDSGTEGWCYYVKTSIDATPESSETTPNYEGDISNHSVVRILDIY